MSRKQLIKKIGYIAIGLSAFVVIALVAYLVIGSEEEQVTRIADLTTTRSTSSGDFIGYVDEYGARAWLGIPYAQPPIGALRWRAPQLVAPHTGTKEAIEFGPSCIQLPNATESGSESSDAIVIGSEDCLYLNIWSAPNSVDAPVMFWIHGGGNTIGSGSPYSGARLAAEKNVVLVTINYRLGVFGWFKHRALETGHLLDDSGNYGTLDVIRALEWVQENISVFGGDPNNVTVFGESAGGFNTLAMIASSLAEGLFHKAIVQSGSYSAASIAYASNLATNGGHEVSSAEVVNKLLLADNTAATAMDAVAIQNDWSAQQLSEYLRSKRPSDFYRHLQGRGFGMISLPSLIEDGFVLPQVDTDELFADVTLHNSVPIILGTNRDETKLFLSLSPEFVDTTLRIFRSVKDKTLYDRLAYYQSAAWKVRGVDALAESFTESGNQNVFAYRFDWDEETTPLFTDLPTLIGAAHTLEIPFVFGHLTVLKGFSQIFPFDAGQARLTEAMMSYWTHFAYSGTPGSGRNGEHPSWERWEPGAHTTLILDTEAGGGNRMITDVLTFSVLEQELMADQSFGDNATKCGIYSATFADTDAWSPTNYEALGCDENTESLGFF